MSWVIGIVIDLVLLAIVILCARRGHKDGFAKTLVSFLGFFVALVVATAVCTPLANLTYNTVVAKPAEKMVANLIDDKVEQYGEVDVDALTYSLTEAIGEYDLLKKAIDAEKISAGIKAAIPSVSENIDSAQMARQINRMLFMPLLVPLLAGIAFILIFVILLIICKILAKSLKLVNKLPLLGGLNALLGGLLGTLKGIIFVLIINWALVLLIGENGSLFSVITYEALQSSLITKYVSLVNPINILFSNIAPLQA